MHSKIKFSIHRYPHTKKTFLFSVSDIFPKKYSHFSKGLDLIERYFRDSTKLNESI